ncbi:MAG: hypothetical protein AAGJ28_11095 [Pseudomonadota bacterium]
MMFRASVVAVSLCAATATFAGCPDHELGRVDIYPTADVLPENVLRLYIYYPRAMGASAGLAQVRLLDAKGSPLDGVFLPMRQDLWSPDRRRLTLLFDPGRVKTGLNANELLGRALMVGQSYTFEVSGTAMDVNGCPLGIRTTYDFTAGPADLDPPDPGGWTLVTPAAGSVAPLRVSLGSAHDHLSLAFRLRVVDAKDEIVPGQISLGEVEESWHFTPRQPWNGSQYALVIEDSLEDLAGNRPGAPFDRPLGQEILPWQSRVPFSPER